MTDDTVSNQEMAAQKKSKLPLWLIIVVPVVLLGVCCAALAATGMMSAILQPIQPTATPRPTPTPIPGWEKFAGQGLELWLPESFEGGDISKDAPLVAKQLRALDPGFEQYAQLIEQNPNIYVLWAYDSKIGRNGFLTNMAVTRDDVLSSVSIDTYLDESLKELPSQMRITEQKRFPINGYEGRRLIIEATFSGIALNEVMYAIKEGHNLWVITYATPHAEFEKRLPIFEQSAKTVTIKP